MSGVSGFICESLDEMVAGLDRLGTIDAATCRAEAQRFTASAMTDQYLRLYDRLIGGHGSPDALARAAA